MHKHFPKILGKSKQLLLNTIIVLALSGSQDSVRKYKMLFLSFCGQLSLLALLLFVAMPQNLQAQNPFISVKQNTTLIPNSTGSHSFGNIAVNSNSGMIQFTVENQGNATLNLSNFQITGTDVAMFTTTNFITTTVNGGANTTFGLQFAPTSVGAKTATVSIGNNALFSPTPSSFTNRTNGLGSNVLLAVYVSGGTIYAATFSGLSISTDGGNTFTNKTTANGLGNNLVRSVYVSGGTIYAGTSGGLSFSTDGGTTFANKTTTNGLGSNNVQSVYVSGGTIYAATTSGLSISTDGGNTFANKTTANGLGNNDVYSVYVSGGTIYAGTSGGLSFSTDGGTTFANRTTVNGLGNNLCLGIYVSGGTIYVATQGGLSISTDGGTTFTNKTTANGLGSNNVRSIYVSEGTIYAGTVAGLSFSTDGGATFTNKTTANGLGDDFVGGIYVSGGTIYAATQGGLSFSNPNPYTFMVTGTGTVQPFISVKQNTTLIPNSTGTHNFGNISVNSNSGMIQFTVENQGNAPLNLSNFQITGTDAAMFTTTNFITTTINGGANTNLGLQFNPTSAGTKTAFISIGNNVFFNPVPNTFSNKTTTSGLGNSIVFGVSAVGSTVYAATQIGLAISTDGGASFSNKTTANGLGNNIVRGVSVVGTNVYAATGGGLAISTDDGATFSNKTTANGLGNNIVRGVSVVGTNVYAATGGGGLSISTDGGANFSNKTTANGLGNNIVNGVFVAGTNVYAATQGGLAISTDGGASFSNKTTANGLGNNQVNGVFVVGTNVYAATEGGLSISTDGGASFTNKTTANGLGNNKVYGVSVVGTNVYAATFGGGLSISTDGGASFTNKTTANGLGNNAVNGVSVVGTNVYAATFGGLSIGNPDPYTFTVTGTGTVQPFISVKQAATLIPTTTETHNFGNINVGANSGDITFTIENTGTVTLNLTSLQITGANAGDFTNTNFVTTTVNAAGNTTFTLKFTPSSAGQRIAFITIGNNSTVNPYTFTLQGTGVALTTANQPTTPTPPTNNNQNNTVITPVVVQNVLFNGQNVPIAPAGQSTNFVTAQPLHFDSQLDFSLPQGFTLVPFEAGKATVSNGKITLKAVGQIKLTIIKPDGTFSQIILNVEKANAFITVSQNMAGFANNLTCQSPAFALPLNSNSPEKINLTVIAGKAEIQNGLVKVLGTGLVKIRATQAENNNFTSAQSIDFEFNVNKSLRIFSLANLANKTFGDADFTLPNDWYSEKLTYSSESKNISISGNTVKILGAGTAVIKAFLAENDCYFGSSFDLLLNVNKASQSINFAKIADQKIGNANVILQANTSANLPVVFQLIEGQNLVSLQANSLKINGIGKVEILASQAGNENYLPAQAEQNFEIFNEASIRITNVSLANKNENLVIDFVMTGFFSENNDFTVFLSNPNGIFEGFVQQISFNGNSGARITMAIPSQILKSGNYKVQIRATIPNVLSNAFNVPRILTPKPRTPVLTRVALVICAEANVTGKYQWYANGKLLPNETNRCITISLSHFKMEANQTITYTVVVADEEGRESEISSPVEVTSDQINLITGIESDLDLNLKVYPNPTKDFLVLDLASPSLRKIEVFIFNMLGQKVLAKSFANSQKEEVLDLQHLPSGTYLLEISNEKSTHRQQIVKE